MEYKLLTFSDVTRFFDAKAIVRNCPSCTSHSWTMQFSRLSEKPDDIFATNALGIGTPFVSNSSPDHAVQLLPFGRPVLPMICNVCGYMKIHDYAVIRKWVDLNPEPAKDGQNGDNEA